MGFQLLNSLGFGVQGFGLRFQAPPGLILWPWKLLLIGLLQRLLSAEVIYREGGRGAHDVLGKKSKSELENDIQ